MVTAIKNLAESLAGDGIAVTLVAPDSIEARLWAERHGIGFMALGRNWLGSSAWLWRPVSRRRLENALRDVDIVHLHSPLFSGVALAKLARAQAIPVVVTTHLMPQNILAALKVLWAGKFRWANKIAWALIGRGLYLADEVTSPSAFGASLIQDVFGRSDIHVISNGVRIDRAICPAPSHTNESAPLRAVFVGRLNREKNIEEMLFAVDACRKADLDIRLTIVGAGPDKSRLMAISHTLGISPFVEFSGCVCDDERNQRCSDADFFWMPSRFELESCAALEAMALSRAVLAGKAGALPALTGDGRGGRLYCPGELHEIVEHVASFRRDRAALAGLGKEALMIARASSIDRTRQKYCQIYRTLIQQRAGWRLADTQPQAKTIHTNTFRSEEVILKARAGKKR
jgi:glycosyltransferase involved in cell wall biosynthesis